MHNRDNLMLPIIQYLKPIKIYSLLYVSTGEVKSYAINKIVKSAIITVRENACSTINNKVQPACNAI